MKRPELVRTALVLAGLWAIVLPLFRGSVDYGMNYDEVLRLTPYVRLAEPSAAKVDQALYRLEVGGLSIPLMVKSYISSIAPLPLVPALFFERQPAALRRAQMLLFLISVSTFFLVLRRHDFALAAWSSFYLATAPHLYPEIRFGFAGVLHVACLAIAAVWTRRGIARPGSSLPWFLAGLAVGLCVNLVFYSLWTVAGGAFALAVVFPRETWRVVRGARQGGALLGGILVGGANYVIYNLATAGGSLRPMVLGLFDRSEYNRRPIDYRVLPDFSTEILDKLRALAVTIGDGQVGFASTALAGLVATALAVLGVAAWRASRAERWSIEQRLYCLAPVALLATFVAILVTPKSGRAGHWAFASPYLELTLAAAGLAVARRRLATGALAGVALLFVAMSNAAVVDANETRGDRLFSATIYDIHADLARPDRRPFRAFAVDWGFWSQLYFLSRGRMPVSELSFVFANRPDAAEKAIIDEISRSRGGGGEVLFLYHEVDVLPGAAATFRRFVAATGAELEAEVFAGPGAGDRHFIARLRNPEAVVAAWRRQRGWSPDPPLIVDYGPRSARVGTPFNQQPGGGSAMWLRYEGEGGPVKVTIAGRDVAAVWDETGHAVTLIFPAAELAQPGTRQIRLCFTIGDVCSAPVELRVLPPG